MLIHCSPVIVQVEPHHEPEGLVILGEIQGTGKLPPYSGVLLVDPVTGRARGPGQLAIPPTNRTETYQGEFCSASWSLTDHEGLTSLARNGKATFEVTCLVLGSTDADEKAMSSATNPEEFAKGFEALNQRILEQLRLGIWRTLEISVIRDSAPRAEHDWLVRITDVTEPEVSISIQYPLHRLFDPGHGRVLPRPSRSPHASMTS